ncbi:MAG: hypothetical protein C0404_00935 [Verrucomicrobia bacterium]|nr:hypothetical protein [Verrucomicrobiota bacterium]
MDILRKGVSGKCRVRFTSADVTVTAKALEARHLSGPVAGKLIGEGLTAVSMLSSDAARKDEAVSIHMTVNGPIQGMLVEATVAGDLRGYTHKKIVEGLDSAATIDTDAAIGSTGNIRIIKTIPGSILGQAEMRVDPPRMTYVVARYFNHSMQIPAAVEIAVRSDPAGLISARGIIAERMPDSDQQAFIRILEAFNKGLVRTQLEKTSLLPDFGAVFGLDDIVEKESRKLQFRCRCSTERAFASFSALSPEDLREIAEAGKPQHVTCHLCGQDYSFTPEEVGALLEKSKGTGQ